MTSRHRSPEYLKNARIVRASLAARIDLGHLIPCVDCGRPIQPDQRWDVGHIVPASKGGSNGLDNLGASHRYACNRAAGGRMGAAITNASSRRARRLPTIESGW